MKTIASLFIFLFSMGCLIVKAQTSTLPDIKALESQYEKFVNEADSPQKAQFTQQLETLLNELSKENETAVNAKTTFTEAEKKEISERGLIIGNLDRWIIFLQKNKIRQLPKFKDVWKKIKPHYQKSPGNPEVYRMQQEYLDKACEKALTLPEAESKKRIKEINAIYTILITCPEDTMP